MAHHLMPWMLEILLGEGAMRVKIIKVLSRGKTIVAMQNLCAVLVSICMVESKFARDDVYGLVFCAL
ncbi:unnamed protein product [Urochloa humidicola]